MGYFSNSLVDGDVFQHYKWAKTGWVEHQVEEGCQLPHIWNAVLNKIPTNMKQNNIQLNGTR